MGGKIDCYFDCVSPYSYFAFLHLVRNQEVLISNDVEIDFHPIFLGGVNVGSGNKPPWTLPAKADYATFDAERARKHFGATETSTPSFFPILSLLPQRALTYIKRHHPKNVFQNTILKLYRAMWNTATHYDISKPEVLRSVLTDSNMFSPAETEAIMTGINDKKYKDLLTAETEKVLKLGAFGAPWFWVRNGRGEEEPFFGSDRFHFMWEFLGLDWQDVKLLPAGSSKEKKAKL